MKNIIFNPAKRVVLLIILYLAALALSTIVIVAYPLSRQKGFYVKHAQEVAEKYLEGKSELPLWMDGRTRVVVYGNSGNIIYDESSTDKEFMQKINCEKYLDRVFGGEQVFELSVVEGTSLISEGLYGAAGVPIYNAGQLAGAAFYIRKIIAVLESALCFALFFSVLYWLSTYFIITSILKQKKMEEERQLYIDNFTHALKTPVASVKVLSEALCDGVITDPLKLQMYYGLILNETTKQSRMIQQILDLSKLQSHQTDMSKSVVDARTLFGPVIERYTKVADLVDVSLHVDENIYSLPALYTNANGIQEIMQILLDNALKYISEGSNIWIKGRNMGKYAEISICDDGPGISKADLPHIFERFYRGSNSDSSESSGLGLAIAHEIIDLLGEKIYAESEEEKGTEFRFTVGMR